MPESLSGFWNAGIWTTMPWTCFMTQVSVPVDLIEDVCWKKKTHLWLVVSTYPSENINSDYNTNHSGYIWLYDGIITYYIYIYISGWWYTYPSENMKVSWDYDIPNTWNVIKVMFQTTNQIFIVLPPCTAGLQK